MFTLSQLRKRTGHDHLVQQLGDLFLYYEETSCISGQHRTLRSAAILGVEYDVCRYVSTGRLPFEEHIDTAQIHNQEENGDCF
jgi:hypothetical protein